MPANPEAKTAYTWRRFVLLFVPVVHGGLRGPQAMQTTITASSPAKFVHKMPVHGQRACCGRKERWGRDNDNFYARF